MVLLGVPTATVWSGVVAAQPSTIVAIISPRDLPALQLLTGETAPQPFAARSAVMRARASEARVRAELREMLATGVPAREVLALEPLLGEHDGLEIAAAALRLLEQTRAAQADLVRETEVRVRTVMKEAMRERDEAPGAGADRFARPRGAADRGARPERGSRPERGGRPERGERGERPRSFTPRGGKPKGFAPRNEKPRGPRRDDGRGPRNER